MKEEYSKEKASRLSPKNKVNTNKNLTKSKAVPRKPIVQSELFLKKDKTYLEFLMCFITTYKNCCKCGTEIQLKTILFHQGGVKVICKKCIQDYFDKGDISFNELLLLRDINGKFLSERIDFADKLLKI